MFPANVQSIVCWHIIYAHTIWLSTCSVLILIHDSPLILILQLLIKLLWVIWILEHDGSNKGNNRWNRTWVKKFSWRIAESSLIQKWCIWNLFVWNPIRFPVENTSKMTLSLMLDLLTPIFKFCLFSLLLSSPFSMNPCLYISGDK